MPTELAPEAIKHRLFEALRGLVLEGAARRPLVLAIEDLHWIDSASAEFLSFLLDHLAAARVLLVCTYRPDFSSTWSRKSYHRVITLTPFAPPDGYKLLTARLGTPHIQDELATLILAKAEGVPFFLEELVQALREIGAIEQHEGQWRLTASASAIPVPDTVQEVLMARIDRLSDGAKSVLQMGAVMGREWSEALLRQIAGLPEGELTIYLMALTEAELLYARGLPPQTTYLFKHALTQEVAYHSLLTAQRCALHHRVAVTLEALFSDRLEELSGQLAHHYVEAAQADAMAKAIEYAVRAGKRHMAPPAYTDAARFYRLALEALARLGTTDEAQRCPLLLALGEAQRKAGEHVQALETLQRAAESARQMGAVADLARAALEFEQAIWRGKLPAEPAVHLLEEVLGMLGEEISVLRARVLGSLARALLFTGVLEPGAAYAQRAVEVARQAGDPGALAFTLSIFLYFPRRPEETEERLAYATEILPLAQVANEEELVHGAHAWRLILWLELGDIQAVDAARRYGSVYYYPTPGALSSLVMSRPAMVPLPATLGR